MPHWLFHYTFHLIGFPIFSLNSCLLVHLDYFQFLLSISFSNVRILFFTLFFECLAKFIEKSHVITLKISHFETGSREFSSVLKMLLIPFMYSWFSRCDTFSSSFQFIQNDWCFYVTMITGIILNIMFFVESIKSLFMKI